VFEIPGYSAPIFKVKRTASDTILELLRVAGQERSGSLLFKNKCVPLKYPVTVPLVLGRT
jgi:hypothetical protein